MKKSKECENCGKSIVPTNTRSLYCCQKCREESRKLLKAQREKKGRTKCNMTVSEINERARAEHLSYGQFVGKYGI